MATATTKKSDQDREQREAKASGGAAYLVLPADPEDFKSFQVKATSKKDAEKKAAEALADRELPQAPFTVERATAAKVAPKAPVDPLAGMKLDLAEIPEQEHGGGGSFGPRDPAKSVWVARLEAVKDSKTGIGLLREYPKKTTAHSIAAALRKNIKQGKYEAAGIKHGDFQIEVRKEGIYARYIKAA